jgi:hypothetical protein
LRMAKYFVANGKAYSRAVEFGSSTNIPHLMLTRSVQSIGF